MRKPLGRSAPEIGNPGCAGRGRLQFNGMRRTCSATQRSLPGSPRKDKGTGERIMGQISVPPLNLFPPGSTLFPASSYLTIYRTRPLALKENPQGRALSCSRTPSPRALGDRRPQRSISRRADPGTRSRCMQAKHPWRLRFALEPLLLEGNRG